MQKPLAKKGYDFVDNGKSFNDDYAVVWLGVGKNMVASIRFWLKAFGITKESGEITKIGEYIFGKYGKDPYLEDVSTHWLLHYNLVKTKYATLYHLFFTDFCKTRHEFSKDQLKNYIHRLFTEKAFGNLPYNENTISRDIATFLKNYVKPSTTKNFDDFSSLLSDLNLLRCKDDKYSINMIGKAKVNHLIFLYAILDLNHGENVIEYQKLLDLSMLFALSQSELYEIFDRLHQYNENICFSNTAGEQLFVINRPIDKWDVLNDYYHNN